MFLFCLGGGGEFRVYGFRGYLNPDKTDAYIYIYIYKEVILRNPKKVVLGSR